MTRHPGVVAVNGRFVTQPLTGVQRYAHEVVSQLAAQSGLRVRLIVPPGEVIDLEPGEVTPVRPDPRWSGGRGHLWEQALLPRLARRAGAGLLVSPAGWGPLGVRRQLVIFHDLHPITHPQYFVPWFVRWTRIASPFLAHVPRRVGVTSAHVQRQVVEHLRVRADRVDVVPPAVGAPFVDAELGDLTARRPQHCLFVGGDKEQKNLAFVLDLWPEVHRRTGLDLVVTERAVGSRSASAVPDRDGVCRVQDPTDAELVDLYRGALCLVWPSRAEGFGIPLLEAMACGTPFLSTDVGAARELAVEPSQVVPLDPRRWIEQLVTWSEADLSVLRHRSAARARAATWARSAAILGEAVRRSAR